MNTDASFKKFSLKFYLLLLALSIPFWLVGAMAENLSKYLPMNLPVSALMFICPLIAALILVYREDRIGGISRLLKRVFDLKRIKQKIWYIPILFLMPIIMLLSYWVMRLMGRPLPEPHIPFLTIPILFIEFFIAAVGEEVGWSGYLVEPMLSRWSALKTSIILGSVWAIWHMVPYIQTHHGLAWVAWQCFATIALRILIVWLYNNTGKSALAAILFHTMINVSDTLFPNNGSHYNPAITGVIIAIMAVIVTFLWGSKTLARYRYA